MGLGKLQLSVPENVIFIKKAPILKKKNIIYCKYTILHSISSSNPWKRGGAENNLEIKQTIVNDTLKQTCHILFLTVISMD